VAARACILASITSLKNNKWGDKQKSIQTNVTDAISPSKGLLFK
jgi:hypothetical protein